MANRVQIGSIWMDGILKRPCFRFEPEDHFPFDPVANIEFRDSTGGPDDIIWIVANNKLIADRPVMHSASFADLQELNLGAWPGGRPGWTTVPDPDADGSGRVDFGPG